MNTPVNFLIAKLLKEKGFEEISSNFYTNPRCKMFGIDEHGRYYPIKNKAKSLWISGNAATLDSKHVYYAPTIAEVVMWLYEKHGIWINVWSDTNLNLPKFFRPSAEWFYVINCDLSDSYDPQTGKPKQLFNSPTEAYEAAIEYTLNNLI